MSDTEAPAQSSEAAEKTPIGAPVSEKLPAQENKTGSDEAINDIESYRRHVNSLPKPEPIAGEVDPVEAEILESNEGGDAPATTPEKAPTETPETPEPEEPVNPGEEEDDQAGADPSKKPPQYRFRPEGAVEELAFDIVKRSTKSGTRIPFEEALVQAKGILKKDEPAAGAGTDANLPKSVQESEAKLTELRSQRKDAMAKELDFVKVAELDEQIEGVKDHIISLKQAEVTTRQQQQGEWEKTLGESKTKAVDLYPDVTKPESELVKEMTALDQEWKDSENPLFNSPDKPYQLALQAANRLGIAPKKKSAAPAAKAPIASSQPVKAAAPAAPVKPPIAPGGTRTTQATNPNGQFDAELEKVSDEDSYRNFTKKFAKPGV